MQFYLRKHNADKDGFLLLSLGEGDWSSVWQEFNTTKIRDNESRFERYRALYKSILNHVAETSPSSYTLGYFVDLTVKIISWCSDDNSVRLMDESDYEKAVQDYNEGFGYTLVTEKYVCKAKESVLKKEVTRDCFNMGFVEEQLDSGMSHEDTTHVLRVALQVIRDARYVISNTRVSFKSYMDSQDRFFLDKFICESDPIKKEEPAEQVG